MPAPRPPVPRPGDLISSDVELTAFWYALLGAGAEPVDPAQAPSPRGPSSGAQPVTPTLPALGAAPGIGAASPCALPEPWQRTLWLVFLDAEDRTEHTLFPIDQVPQEIEPRFLSALGDIVASLVTEGLASSVPVLLERPGPAEMTPNDRDWARAVRQTLGPPVRRWPVHLATCGGVRPFAPDDLIMDSAPGDR